MTEEEIRTQLRKIAHIGVPKNTMARDAGVATETIKRLLSDQEVWKMRDITKETLEDYIDWIKSTLGF